jgi:hypothetical protein
MKSPADQAIDGLRVRLNPSYSYFYVARNVARRSATMREVRQSSLPARRRMRPDSMHASLAGLTTEGDGSK